MPASADGEDQRVAYAPTEGAFADALTYNALPGELDGLSEERLRNIAAFAAEATRRRQPGTPNIYVASGGSSDGRRLSWIVINNDDMPFLVDSVAAIVAGHGLAISRLLHPVIDAERTSEGELRTIRPHEAGSKTNGIRESLIFIEMERADARTRAELAAEIETALADVRMAVTDWKAMLARLEADIARTPDPNARTFLSWLADNNFTFLGHNEIRANDPDPSGGLGIMKGANAPPLLNERESARAALNVLRHADTPLLIAKADRISTIHRRVRMDVVSLPLRDADGQLIGISNFIGLFTSQALSAPPDKVPLLAERVDRLVASLDFAPGGHAAKALTHAVQQFPRDLLFELDDNCLRDIALTAMSLIDRPRPKIKTVRDPLGRYTTVLAWLPRDDFSSQRRMDIADMAARSVDGVLDGWTSRLGDDAVVSLRYVIRHARDRAIDAAALDAQLQDMVRGWNTAVENALRTTLPPTRAARLALTHGNAFSQSYRSQFGPEEAAQDIQRLAALSTPDDRDVRFFRLPGDRPDQLRLKIYRLHAIIPLSDVVPVLENFGFRVIEEFPFDLDGGKRGWIHDFLVESQSGPVDLDIAVHALEPAIRAVLTGATENDSFNALIAGVGLDGFAVQLFRAWFRYLRQAGSVYGQQTVVDALRRYPEVARALVRLFTISHDPALAAASRSDTVQAATDDVKAALMQVAAIDDDAILRRFLALVIATLRTNAFVPGGPEALAMKLDSRAIPGLPAPVPWREIFVYSPRVEGIHLRGGPVARGGIRWSDRRDDFRTEILGLIKAQMVKNAVIVPTGAKGGFYPKLLPPPTDRDAWLAEGTEAYRIYIRALLSLTDNLADGRIVHPGHIVIHDGDDPYFVVAADKGTAAFSDIANAIAVDHGFWLGDAFASGGSNGYDHKAMGITARGAWISVQRHFAEKGIDIQNDPVTVAGVGDMSGDVFGNGMLLSKAIRLVAAFDHRHIFIDPAPDAAAGWAERKRLFDLPRSSWADYDAKLISKGGGVWPRTQKEIPLSPEAKALLGLSVDTIGPSALIEAILKAEVDLLWFGGIGTYIKGTNETNAQAGDRANDAHRVNGRNVRARVIGEGANLGVTQAGRIEYAARGGRINTDFIDNSAGVDCSDNEVNIKIALNAEMTAGRLSFKDRNSLLHGMTDDVAALVLEDNRLQTLALSLAEHGGNRTLPSYPRVIQTLEATGRLDRSVEGLPDDELLAARARDGRGLERPELAVVLAYAKLALQDAIEQAGFGDDPLLETTLLNAFPAPMVDRFEEAIRRHRLHREIVATKLANRLINRNGIILPFALAEEEGCALGHVAAAYAAAEALFDLPRLWADIENAQVDAKAELALMDATSAAVRLHVADLVRISPPGSSPSDIFHRLSAGMARMAAQLDELLRDNARGQAEKLRATLSALPAPPELVERIVSLHALDGAVGIADLAVTLQRPDQEMALAHAYSALGEALGVDWAQGAALALDPADPWEKLLVAGLVRDFEQFRIDLLERITTQGRSPQEAADQWLADNAPRIAQFRALIARARMQAIISPTILAQIASQARVLLGR